MNSIQSCPITFQSVILFPIGAKSPLRLGLCRIESRTGLLTTILLYNCRQEKVDLIESDKSSAKLKMEKGRGDLVNLEVDMLLKMVERHTLFQ